MTMLKRAITAGFIAATMFIGSTAPTSAQVSGGGKECDTTLVIIYDDYGIIDYWFEETCVEVLDDDVAQ